MVNRMSPQGLGTIVKDLRTSCRKSQRELGKLAKVSDAYIALLETNQRKNPSLAVLRRIAKALNVPVAALLK